MFGTIRKHQTWLWIVIIAVMVVSLVIFFSPTAGPGGDRGSGNRIGLVDGEKVTPTDYRNAQREAYLGYLLMTGNMPTPASGYDEERETYLRLFFKKKIKDHKIRVDDEAVAQAARNTLTRLGGGQPVPLDDFLQQVRVTEQDFERYIRTELGLQQLLSAIGLSGELVTPQEARALYTQEHQEIATQAVFYSGTNYQTSVPAPTPAILSEFYTNQMMLYRLPERMQLQYVSFPASNFMAQADQELAAMTNLSEIVEQEYQQRGTNAFPDAATPEAARQKIRQEIRQNRALMFAYRQAETFMDQLLSMEPVTSENLERLARTNGITVSVTAPFDTRTGPIELDGDQRLAQTAFRLTAEQPFPDRPHVTEQGVYVFGFGRRIPSEMQPYEVVKDRVAEDYKRVKAAENARRAGSEFANAVAQGLNSGKTFAAVAAEQNVKPVSLPPISLSTTNLPQLEGRVNLFQFRGVAFGTEPGKASEFSPTADGGFVVYVDKRLPIEEAKLNAELPAFTRMIRQARRQEAINAWVQKEATRALADTPLMERLMRSGGS